MKLHQLRIFESVARHLNITAAADELGMSQPAASLQLKLLEDEYRLQFFDRNNRGMELTAQGQDFLDAVRPVISNLISIDAEFRARGKKSDLDTLKIGAAHTLSSADVPAFLIEFQKIRPNAQIILETGASGSIEALVHSLKLDIAFISYPSYLPNCVYEAYDKQEYETVAFAPPGHPLCGQTLTLNELSKYPLIVRGGSACIHELQRRGFTPNIVMQCHDPESVKVAVRKGLGIGLLFTYWVSSDLDNGNVKLVHVPELKAVTWESFMVYDKRRQLSPSAKDFMKMVKALRMVPQHA